MPKSNAEIIADELARMYREHLEGEITLSDDMLQLAELLDDYKEIQEKVGERAEKDDEITRRDFAYAYRVAKYGS